MQSRNNKANFTAENSIAAELISVLRKRGCLKSPVRSYRTPGYFGRLSTGLRGEGADNCPFYRDSLHWVR
jgi:hypothetical protein